MERLRTINPGIAMGLGAYAIWGLLPAYLKLVRPLPAPDILAYRVLFSLALLALVLLALRRHAGLVRILRSPRLTGALALSATLIAVNWLIYIDAVNRGHVKDASLGYFINPLVNVALGTLVLRERLGRVELAAVTLAATAVAVLAIARGALPWIPLALAFSFAFYGLVRKMTTVDALDGLFVETVLLAPLAAAWLATSAAPGAGVAPGWPLIAASGAVTAAPLLLFAGAAKRIRYADLGLLQYIAPTIQLSLALVAFGERLAPVELACFAMIWTALALYAGGASWRARRLGTVAPE